MFQFIFFIAVVFRWLLPGSESVWPNWAIYWTLGNFLKPLAIIHLPKSPTFFGNFCEVVQIYPFFCWNHYWATFIDIWQFFMVTLLWVSNSFSSSFSLQDISNIRRIECTLKWQDWSIAMSSNWAPKYFITFLDCLILCHCMVKRVLYHVCRNGYIWWIFT